MNVKREFRKKPPGFTLIEMMVVMGVISLIVLLVMPNLTSYFQMSLNSATRDLASSIKETYNSAVLTGKVYRIAFDFKENNFWVESGPTEALLSTKKSLEKEERRKKLFSRREAPPPSPFQMDTTVTRKKISLPRGVTYEDVVTQERADPIIEGIAYSHFFPRGLTEQTIIHLQDSSKHHASLVITPLMGMTELYDRYIKRDEAFGK